MANQPLTKSAFVIVRAANGLIVRPPYAHGEYQAPEETYVFRTMADLAAWLVAEEAKR